MIRIGFIIISMMICKILILALVLTATANTQSCLTIENCLLCNVPDTCDQCNTTYFLDNGNCTACIDNC